MPGIVHECSRCVLGLGLGLGLPGIVRECSRCVLGLSSPPLTSPPPLTTPHHPSPPLALQLVRHRIRIREFKKYSDGKGSGSQRMSAMNQAIKAGKEHDDQKQTAESKFAEAEEVLS